MHHYNVYTSITILYVNVDRPGPSQMPGGDTVLCLSELCLGYLIGS